MRITQLDSENADRNLTSLVTVLTHTPSADHAVLCQATVALGDGTKNLDGTGGDFECRVLVGGQEMQPSPQTIAFEASVARAMVQTMPFMVPAGAQVLVKVLSPNGADTDVDVTARLYDVGTVDVVAVNGGAAQQALAGTRDFTASGTHSATQTQVPLGSFSTGIAADMIGGQILVQSGARKGERATISNATESGGTITITHGGLSGAVADDDAITVEFSKTQKVGTAPGEIGLTLGAIDQVVELLGEVTVGGIAGGPVADIGAEVQTRLEAGVTTLANDAITAATIANDAITSAKIADNAIAAAKIAANAIAAAKIASDALAAAKIAADARGYAAQIRFNRDEANSRDEWTVAWFKLGASTAATSVTLALHKRDGTALKAETAMTQVGTLEAWKLDVSTAEERVTPGDDVVAVASATIDGGTRTFTFILGRDATA